MEERGGKYRDLVVKPEWKRPPRISSPRWKDNIKMDFQ